MENNENNPQNSQNCSSSNPDKSCCSTLFTKDDQGNKKLSLLSWSILLVLLIGAIGIISSKKQDEKELVKNTNELATQLQKESNVLQAKAKMKYKAQEAQKNNELQQEEAVAQQIKEMQEAHNKQMLQAQKAFENLKSAYSQKLNQVVKDMKTQQEAKEEEVPNPELNFQLRGLSNIRVQFNKHKDISYIEIIQPEKSCWDSKKEKGGKGDNGSWQKKYKGCEEKEYKKDCPQPKSWNDCKPKSKCDPYKQKGYDMPTPQNQYNKSWDCKPMKSDCEKKWDSKPTPNKTPGC
jgi:hypothetical protein